MSWFSHLKNKIMGTLGVMLVLPLVAIANVASTDNFSPVDIGEPLRAWPDSRPNQPILRPEKNTVESSYSLDGEAVYRANVETRQVMPRKILYEQEILGRYALYQQKIKPLLEELKSLDAFLKSEMVNNPRISKQKLAAHANLLKLKQDALNETLKAYEKKYLTYQGLTDATQAYTKVLDNWLLREKERQTQFYSQAELDSELDQFQSATIKLQALLSQLNLLFTQQEIVTKNPNQ